MSKYINYYLIICYTLFLYCCKDYNHIPAKNNPTNDSNTVQAGSSQTYTNGNNILTKDEQNKFNLLKNSLDKINLIFTNNVLASKAIQDLEKLQRVTSIYPGFIAWLLKDIPKQKELANAFDSAYNILESKRKTYAPDKTLEQYISNAIDCGFDVSCTRNNEGRNNKYGQYDKFKNLTFIFFKDILINMTRQYTNEEIFKALKADLTNTIVDSLLYLLKKWQ